MSMQIKQLKEQESCSAEWVGYAVFNFTIATLIVIKALL